jgi:hypothetical protein
VQPIISSPGWITNSPPTKSMKAESAVGIGCLRSSSSLTGEGVEASSDPQPTAADRSKSKHHRAPQLE